MIRFNDRIVRTRQTSKGEKRDEIRALVTEQSTMHLPKNSDVDEDDIVEWTNPAGHRKLLRVIGVKFSNSPFGTGGLDHTEIHLAAAARPRPATPVESVRITGMHPDVSAAAAALYADGYYSQAVFEAFKAVEARVKDLSELDQSGKKLMSMAFGTAAPTLDITTTTGQNAVDEREGFNQLFMGATQGIRNPRGHGDPLTDKPDEAIEYLAVASMLMRRLDLAESRLASDATSV